MVCHKCIVYNVAMNGMIFKKQNKKLSTCDILCRFWRRRLRQAVSAEPRVFRTCCVAAVLAEKRHRSLLMLFEQFQAQNFVL